MELGQQIKERLKKDNMKVPALATLLGIKEGRIYKWQKGTKPSDADDLIKLRKWLESVPNGTKNVTSRKGTEQKDAMFLNSHTNASGAYQFGNSEQLDHLLDSLNDRIKSLEKDKDELKSEVKKWQDLYFKAIEKK